MSPPDARRRFEAVALPHTGALYRTAARMARTNADAEEWVQETFLRAYRTFENFTEGTNARAWLFSILRSIVINAGKNKSRAGESTTFTDLEERSGVAVDVVDPTAEERVAENPGIDRGRTPVHRALAQLPEKLRMPLLLIDVGELTYEEAASVLVCPVGTVRSRLSRGRKAMAKTLAPPGAPATPTGAGGSERPGERDG